MYRKSLHLYGLILAAATLTLILAGGLVTSTGSGLSVPDWPLSYGSLFPPMIGGIRFEHTHRLIAGFVGLLTLGFMVTVLFLEKRGWMKGLTLLALVMVVAQAVLGGLTVKYMLPDPISVSHACLGQSFFAVACLLALFSSREWHEAPRIEAKRARSIQRLLLTTLAFVYLQLVLGASVRHTERHYGLNWHFMTAFMVLIHAVYIIPKVAKEKPVQNLFLRPAMFLATLVSTQVFLGLASYIWKIVMEKAVMPRTAEVLFTTAHQTTGALILGTTAVLTVRTFRLLSPKKAA